MATLGMGSGAPAGNPNGGNAPQTNTGAVSSAGGTALGAAVGGIIGMGQGAINNNQNKKAQQRAFNMQKDLNRQAKELALQQWKDTNASAQVREYKKAGLNIGLMYEGGGAGGQTATGSGGSAPNQQSAHYDVTGGMGMGIMGSQQLMNMKLMEAQINKMNAEAENLRGVSRDNIIADTGLKQINTANQQILNEVQNKTIDETVMGIIANADKAQSEARTAQVGANVNENTEETQIKQIKQNAVNTALQAGAIKAGIKLTEEQTRKIGVELAQGWEELYQKARSNDNQKGMVNIAGFKAKLDEILGKANIDLRAKELMVRSAEAVMSGISKNTKPKGSTTETFKDNEGGTTSNTTYH